MEIRPTSPKSPSLPGETFGKREESMSDIVDHPNHHMSVHGIDNQLVDSAEVCPCLENGG